MKQFMRFSLLVVCTALLLPTSLVAQWQRDNILQAGPMPGHSAMREVTVWLQTIGTHEVHLKYWPQDDPSSAHVSELYTTRKADFFTCHLVADSVEPGIRYAYEIWVDGKPVQTDYPLTFQSQPLWQYRTDPPALRFAIGSCAYINETEYDRPGKPYGGGYHIFESIYKQKPEMMVWLGDNTYLREADWDSRTGILRRYTHDRSIPEMQPLLGSAHHFAIWDDHDFGPNDADGSFVNKAWTLEAFQLFWANPTYGTPDMKGIMGRFQFYDADFFLLDNRWHRTPRDEAEDTRQILGKQQVDWLIDNLKYSRAPFKFVCVGGQVLNTFAGHENHAVFAREREYLINRITAEKIKGVIFLTGDRHHSELSKLTQEGITIYDLTVSPLTSTAYNAQDEENEHRVADTHVGERNFGILELTGPRKERVLAISIFDGNGELLWKRELPAAK